MKKAAPPKKGSGKWFAEQRLRRRAMQSGQVSGTPVEIIDETSWQGRVLDSELPVVVEFFTVFCPPCRMLEPVLEQFASEYAMRVRTVGIRMDENVSVSHRYGISEAPTLLVMNHGEVLTRFIGPVEKNVIVQALETFDLL